MGRRRYLNVNSVNPVTKAKAMLAHLIIMMMKWHVHNNRVLKSKNTFEEGKQLKPDKADQSSPSISSDVFSCK